MLWLNQAHASSFTPPQGTEIASHWDQLYSFLIYSSLISGILVIAGMTYFAYRYRRRSENDKTAYISHNVTLEFLWSFIPFVIFLVVFAWGWWLFHDMRSMPKDALEVHVVGQKWYWDFQYKSGRKSSGEFYVPVNQPVKLIMSSRDVLHSFYIPGFRIKQDVVPGRYSSLWFEADKIGKFQVFCTEYCGDGHSAMLAKVNVVSGKDYEAWLAKGDPYEGLSMAQVGEKVFEQKCSACHNVSAERKVGPGFAGVFGSERKFADGSATVANENYIRESVLNPNGKVVEGYPAGVMPTFAGQIEENELVGIIEYIKSLK
ncbi:MAG: cytochrome c oxidase subunit II [Pseudobdellovibrionaceae bacterium]|nr:cytochrome c oxidase subunit II [Bdellovibrionales bacterium]USN46635.1 MAG: cytochrome c oxidase subunit II [Pseudobdellovibrionaceae bacterium]